MSASAIRHTTELLHDMTGRYEDGFRHYLDKLARQNESGFSPETLAMIWMANDASTLRRLAADLDREREKLIANELVISLVAAE